MACWPCGQMKHTFGAGAPSLGDDYSLGLSDRIGMDEMEGFLLRFYRMKTEEKTAINLSGFFWWKQSKAE